MPMQVFQKCFVGKIMVFFWFLDPELGVWRSPCYWRWLGWRWWRRCWCCVRGTAPVPTTNASKVQLLVPMAYNARISDGMFCSLQFTFQLDQCSQADNQPGRIVVQKSTCPSYFDAQFTLGVRQLSLMPRMEQADPATPFSQVSRLNPQERRSIRAVLSSGTLRYFVRGNIRMFFFLSQ